MDEESLNNLSKLMTALNPKALSQDDFIASIEKIITFVSKNHELTKQELLNLRDLYTQAVEETKSGNTDKFAKLQETIISTLTKETEKFRNEHTTALQNIQEKADSLEDGKDADEEKIVTDVLARIQLPEYKETVLDTAEQTVEKINNLPTDSDDFKIDYSHIKNVPKNNQNPTVISNHGPLWSLNDVDVSGITAGQSIQWDGARWIPYTPSGGTGSTPVFNEIVSGTGTTFTLANTPVSGTVRLYGGSGTTGGSSRLVVGQDYTISGKVITIISNSYPEEGIIADYLM